MGSWLDGVGHLAESVGKGVWDGAKGVAEGAGELAKGAEHATADAWQGAVDGAKAAAGAAEHAVSDVARGVGRGARDLAEGARHGDVLGSLARAQQDVAAGAGRGLSDAWNGTAEAVGKVYQGAVKAEGDAGAAVSRAYDRGVDGLARGVSDVAGRRAGDAVRAAAQAVAEPVRQAAQFEYGVQQGVAEGAGSLVRGLGDLAVVGVRAEIDPQYRAELGAKVAQLAGRAGQAIAEAAHDPGGAARAAGHAVEGLVDGVVQGGVQAAREGRLSEYIGHGVGRIGFEVVATVGLPEAKAAEAAGAVGRLAETAGEAGRVLEGVGEVGRAAEGAGDVGKIGEAAADAGKAAQVADASGDAAKAADAATNSAVDAERASQDAREATTARRGADAARDIWPGAEWRQKAAEIQAASRERWGFPEGARMQLGASEDAGWEARIAKNVPEASKAAESALAKAAKAEKALTKSVQDAAEEAGGEMIGLGHRLKTAESLSDKIARDMAKEDLSADVAAANVSDAVRYTASFPPDKLVEGAQATLSKLKDEGNEIVQLKNTWLDPGSSYKGVNVQLRSPNGQMFELQFHTPESFWAKEEGTHQIYERMRQLDPMSEEWAKLNKKQKEIAQRLQIPDGIEKLQIIKKDS